LGISVAINVILLANLVSDQQFRTYGRLHPAFSELSDDDAGLLRFRFSRNHGLLLEQLNREFPQFAARSAAVYFETLNNGGQIGINDNDRMLPGSLRKIPVLAAAYKQVEAGVLRLDDKVELQLRHLDLALGVGAAIGPLTAKGAGQKLTIQQLVDAIAEYSDNAAAAALLEKVGSVAYGNAMFGLGMLWSNWLENIQSLSMLEYPATTYEFAQIFRSLYFSSYLRPEHSEKILRLLGNKNFPLGLPAGIPPWVAYAHKTGDWRRGAHHHDCGIVYFPHKPYLLCVMTRGMDNESANRLIAEISKVTYQYVETIRETR
jgi:beta-lactamase class A